MQSSGNINPSSVSQATVQHQNSSPNTSPFTSARTSSTAQSPRTTVASGSTFDPSAPRPIVVGDSTSRRTTRDSLRPSRTRTQQSKATTTVPNRGSASRVHQRNSSPTQFDSVSHSAESNSQSWWITNQFRSWFQYFLSMVRPSAHSNQNNRLLTTSTHPSRITTSTSQHAPNEPTQSTPSTQHTEQSNNAKNKPTTSTSQRTQNSKTSSSTTEGVKTHSSASHSSTQPTETSAASTSPVQNHAQSQSSVQSTPSTENQASTSTATEQHSAPKRNKRAVFHQHSLKCAAAALKKDPSINVTATVIFENKACEQKVLEQIFPEERPSTSNPSTNQPTSITFDSTTEVQNATSSNSTQNTTSSTSTADNTTPALSVQPEIKLKVNLPDSDSTAVQVRLNLQQLQRALGAAAVETCVKDISFETSDLPKLPQRNHQQEKESTNRGRFRRAIDIATDGSEQTTNQVCHTNKTKNSDCRPELNSIVSSLITTSNAPTTQPINTTEGTNLTTTEATATIEAMASEAFEYCIDNVAIISGGINASDLLPHISATTEFIDPYLTSAGEILTTRTTNGSQSNNVLNNAANELVRSILRRCPEAHIQDMQAASQTSTGSTLTISSIVAMLAEMMNWSDFPDAIAIYDLTEIADYHPSLLVIEAMIAYLTENGVRVFAYESSQGSWLGRIQGVMMTNDISRLTVRAYERLLPSAPLQPTTATPSPVNTNTAAPAPIDSMLTAGGVLTALGSLFLAFGLGIHCYRRRCRKPNFTHVQQFEMTPLNSQSHNIQNASSDDEGNESDQEGIRLVPISSSGMPYIDASTSFTTAYPHIPFEGGEPPSAPLPWFIPPMPRVFDWAANNEQHAAQQSAEEDSDED